MSSYVLNFSDPTKTTTVTVPGSDVGPGINNYDTSLDLVGSGYSNYGYAIGQNFLKLLENFSSPVSPLNAIEGQLWYDTSNPSKKVLRVNNGTLTGTRWQPVSGIYYQPNDPDFEYSSVVTNGDLWVDTSSTQLKIKFGGDWLVVGPNTTSGITKTGTEAATLESNTGTMNPVILNWVNGSVVGIFASSDFIPKTVIDGFYNLKPGFNLTSRISSKFNGVADRALSLQTPSGAIINAADVLKNKATSQTHTGTFIVEGSSGLIVQNSIVNRSINIYNSSAGGFVDFSDVQSTLRVGVGTNSYIKFNAAHANVGINTSTFSSSPTLDVAGTGRFFGTLTIAVSTSSVSGLILKGGSTIDGSVVIQRSLLVNGRTTSTGVLVVGEQGAGDVAIIQPANNNTYDIGSPTRSFRTIYVSNIGTTGTNVQIYGTVNGTTTQLATSRLFSINGQVTSTPISFNGTGNVSFTTSLTRDAIAAQTPTSTTAPTQTLLVLNTSSGTSSLERISKPDFLSDVYPFTVKTGMILPYGSSTPPTGYLICNGASLDRVTYATLFSVIGTTYGSASISTFRVPNMIGVTTAVGGFPIHYIIKT